MESLNAEFSGKIIKSFASSSWLGIRLYLDISEIFFILTKFPVAIVSGGESNASFCILREHMINESRDMVDEIPSS